MILVYSPRILFHQNNALNLSWKQLSAHNYMYMGFCKPIWASNELWHTLNPFVADGIPTFSSVSIGRDGSRHKNVLVLTEAAVCRSDRVGGRKWCYSNLAPLLTLLQYVGEKGGLTTRFSSFLVCAWRGPWEHEENIWVILQLSDPTAAWFSSNSGDLCCSSSSSHRNVSFPRVSAAGLTHMWDVFAAATEGTLHWVDKTHSYIFSFVIKSIPSPSRTFN